jgi:hypothetical protein
MDAETTTGLPPERFVGKTYTLRPDAPDSDSYYSTIADLADSLLKDGLDAQELLATVRWLGLSKRNLRRLIRRKTASADSLLVESLRTRLAMYTRPTRDHLKQLKKFDRLDRTLTTAEEQYHLYMLEIELGNRLYADEFRRSDVKLAFLPHCLRDLKADCQAARRDIDFVCKGCTESCTVNRVSKTLRLHKVKPFIWMEANLKSVFKRVRKGGGSLGVLGIACVPELAKGMRLCHKHGVPAIGIPLDANRCSRWWGRFHWNSVNLKKLESLLADPA